MYLTVCLLRDPGHDNSVGELMHLTLSSAAQVMIIQWENECISLSAALVFPVAWVQFLALAEYFMGCFPGWWHLLPCAQFREDQRAEWCPSRKILSISCRLWDAYEPTWSTTNKQKPLSLKCIRTVPSCLHKHKFSCSVIICFLSSLRAFLHQTCLFYDPVIS